MVTSPEGHFVECNFVEYVTCLNVFPVVSNVKTNRRRHIGYRNVPKFSDRQVWSNSADTDQTAPRGF